MKNNKTPMDIMMDYDDFGIYSGREDIQNYIESLFNEGIESDEEMYSMCIEKFGVIYTDIINEIFNEED